MKYTSVPAELRCLSCATWHNFLLTNHLKYYIIKREKNHEDLEMKVYEQPHLQQL